MTKSENPFRKRWRNAKVARIAHLRTLGWSSKMIARELNDGTLADTIRSVCHRWRLPVTLGIQRRMMGNMSHSGAALIVKEAERLGMHPADFVGKVAEYAARGRLYEAIVDEN